MASPRSPIRNPLYSVLIDRLQPTWTVAYPGAGKVFVKYVLRPQYTRVSFFRGTNPRGPFAFIQDALPGTGLVTDSNVVNGATYCYQAVAFDGLNHRSQQNAPSCATPKAYSYPPHGFIRINGGERVTVSPKVTLTLWASDSISPESVVPGSCDVPLPPSSSASGVKDMLIGNRTDLTDGVLGALRDVEALDVGVISAPGAFVYVKYRDTAGNESSVALATIDVVPLNLGVCTTAPLGQANNFNLFTFGDLTQSATDVQGRVAAGGNAKLTSYGIGSLLTNSHGTRDDLIVDSRITYTDGTVYNGNVTFGATATLTRVNIPNGHARQAHPLSFAAEQVNLELESTAWST